MATAAGARSGRAASFRDLPTPLPEAPAAASGAPRRPPVARPAPRPLPDEDLMSAFATGDLEAFGELVARHRAAVIGFCRRLLGDPHEAEDAAQDAFVALYRCGPRYVPSAPFRALLYRLARNACADARRRPAPLPGPDLPETQDPDPGAPEAAERRLRAAELRRAVARLTPLQREALVLTHFEGLTYTEAAAVLRVPVGTVCSRAAAALAALRRLLPVPGEEGGR